MIDAPAIGAVRSVLLLGAAAVLVYALARYRHNVLQRPAFSLAVGAAVGLAASQLLSFTDAPLLAVEALQLVAAGLYLGATWLFAAEFVDVGDEEGDPTPPELDLSAEGGGFKDD